MNTQPPPQPRAIIYTRHSPKPAEQADRTETAEAQEQLCREYCSKHGYTVFETVFSDPLASGGDGGKNFDELKDDRPGLWAALAETRRGDVLVVLWQSRLARSLRFYEIIRWQLTRKGARIEVVQGSANGDSIEAVLLRQILAAVDEFNRKASAAAISAIVRAYQKNGRRCGQIPYGFMLGPPRTISKPDGSPKEIKTLVPNPDEVKAMDAIKEWRLAGKSLGQIKLLLELYDHKPRGGRWHCTQITRILTAMGVSMGGGPKAGRPKAGIDAR